jgi:ketosteroid isomerase-like protein
VSQGKTSTRERNLEKARTLAGLYEGQGPWAIEPRFDEFFRPDFEWRPAVTDLGDKTYIGLAGFREWQHDIEEVTDEAIQTGLEVEAIGERVVLVLSRMRIVGKGSGAEFESEYGAVYEMADGRGVRGRAFLSHEEARREAEAWSAEVADAQA